jgi:hypothetical protein
LNEIYVRENDLQNRFSLDEELLQFCLPETSILHQLEKEIHNELQTSRSVFTSAFL